MRAPHPTRVVLAVGAMLVLTGLLAGTAATQSPALGTNDPVQENESTLEDGYYSNPTEVSVGEHDYLVHLQQGEQLYVGVYFADENDPAGLNLFGPDGSRSTGRAGLFGDTYLLHNVTQAGTYRIWINTHASPDDYAIEVRTGRTLLPWREPNSHWGVASPLLPGTYEGREVRHPEDDDFYSVYVEQGQTLEASIAFSHSDADLDLVVHDHPLEGAVASSRSSSDDESVSYTPEEAGIYYVGVRPTEGTPATYDLSLSLEGEVNRDAWVEESYFGGVSAGAAPIDPETYSNQSLQREPSSGNAYAFRARAGDLVNVTVTEHTGEVPPLMVHSRRDNVRWRDAENVSLEAPYDGIYVIDVGAGLGPGVDRNSTYTLTLEGARPWPEGDGRSSGGSSFADGVSGLPGFGIPAAIVAILCAVAIVRRV